MSVAQADTLWLRLTAIYGHRFTSAYGDDPSSVAGDTWSRTLADLSPAQLATGLRACAMSADGWPPTLPQFRAMCFNIPTLAIVRLDVRNRDFSHPFTALTWEFLDHWGYHNSDAERSARLLADAYDIARQHILAGGEYLPEVVAIAAEPVPEKTPEQIAAMREEGRKAREELLAWFGTGQPTNEANPS